MFTQQSRTDTHEVMQYEAWSCIEQEQQRDPAITDQWPEINGHCRPPPCDAEVLESTVDSADVQQQVSWL